MLNRCNSDVARAATGGWDQTPLQSPSQAGAAWLIRRHLRVERCGTLGVASGATPWLHRMHFKGMEASYPEPPTLDLSPEDSYLRGLTVSALGAPIFCQPCTS